MSRGAGPRPSGGSWFPGQEPKGHLGLRERALMRDGDLELGGSRAGVVRRGDFCLPGLRDVAPRAVGKCVFLLPALCFFRVRTSVSDMLWMLY